MGIIHYKHINRQKINNKKETQCEACGQNGQYLALL